MRHLSKQQEFTDSFKKFCAPIQGLFKDEQNYIRLFDMWLSNYKDERVIEHQLKKEPWQDGEGDDKNPWD